MRYIFLENYLKTVVEADGSIALSCDMHSEFSSQVLVQQKDIDHP
jgi:hypothetical protein